MQKENEAFILRQHLTNEVSLVLLRKIQSENVPSVFCISTIPVRSVVNLHVYGITAIM